MPISIDRRATVAACQLPVYKLVTIDEQTLFAYNFQLKRYIWYNFQWKIELWACGNSRVWLTMTKQALRRRTMKSTGMGHRSHGIRTNILGSRLKEMSICCVESARGSTEARFEMVETFLAACEPQAVGEALETEDSCNWVKGTNEEFEFSEENKAWLLISRPSDINLISNCWIFKRNYIIP